MEAYSSNKEVASNLTQVQYLFLEYERKHYPEAFSRAAIILSKVRNLQECPASFARVLFPKVNDVKNFVNHVYSNILSEL